MQNNFGELIRFEKIECSGNELVLHCIVKLKSYVDTADETPDLNMAFHSLDSGFKQLLA